MYRAEILSHGGYRSFVVMHPDFWMAGRLPVQRCPLENVTIVLNDEEFESEIINSILYLLSRQI